MKSTHESDPGFSVSVMNPLTNEENILYDNGLKEKPRWTVACVEHGRHSKQKNKRNATNLLKTPELWCQSCLELDEIRKAEKILNNSNTRPDDRQMKMWAMLAQGSDEKCRLFEQIYGVKPDIYW